MLEPFITICLAGAPRGKGRPRFSNAGQFVRVYTDAPTRLYESRLKSAGIEAMNGKEPLDEALSVTIDAFMPIPASFSKTKRAAALAFDIMPTGKPDMDNIEKCCGDALNKVVWRDDSIIVRWLTTKLYSEQPRLEITVWRWG